MTQRWIRPLLLRIDIEQPLEKIVGPVDVVNAAFADQPAGLRRIEYVEQRRRRSSGDSSDHLLKPKIPQNGIACSKCVPCRS